MKLVFQKDLQFDVIGTLRNLKQKRASAEVLEYAMVVRVRVG